MYLYTKFCQGVSVKKIFAVLLITILIISALFLGSNSFYSIDNIATAESGAPTLNGTAVTTWYIEASDNIYRANENIITTAIQINDTGTMDWLNVTCETTGNITINALGSFGLINCILTLTGDLIIDGSVTFRNTTLKMNPAQNAEYQIRLQGINAELYIYDLDSDPLTQYDYSKLTSAIPDGNHRYGFQVLENTKFIMKNSELSQCGNNDSYPGLTIKTDSTLIENCEINNNYIGVNHLSNTNNNIINCNISQNSYAGIKIYNGSNNNLIKTSRFNNNGYGIFIGSANNISISGCDFAGSTTAHLHISNSSDNDVDELRGVAGVHSLELAANSNNNKFNNCDLQFNSGNIATINDCKNNKFTDCNFTTGSLNGVTLMGASNNTFNKCNMSKNSGWGIYIDMNNGEGNIIQSSVISDNIGEGVRIEFSESRNRVINSRVANNSIGVYLKSSAGIDIVNSNITTNTNYGLYFFTGAKNNILNTNISNTPTAIYFTKRSRYNYINDSVIYNSTTFDLLIEGSSNLTSINTIFNKINIDIRDSSNLTIKWYLDAKVEDLKTSAPLENAIVAVKDALHSTYHTYYKTDDTGQLDQTTLTESFMTSTSIFKHTPHRIQASKPGYVPEFQDVTVDTNQDLVFRLKERVLPHLPDFVIFNLSVSNITPLQNQEITIDATIFNNGTENLTGQDINVNFYVDNNTLIHSANISSLFINSYKHVITNWVVNLTNGSHVLRVEADAYNSTFELNETNNNQTLEMIVNTEPIAILYSNRTEVTSLELIEFDARNSKDEVLEIVAYLFDFGDGNTSNWINETIVEYGYPHPGTFNARLRVRDASGLMSKWSAKITITVANRRPIAGFTYSPELGYVTTSFAFEPNGSFDPDGIIASYSWEFGDGTNSAEASPNHTFSDDITYQVQLTVFDDNGQNSTVFDKIISVNNLPPTAKFTVNKDKVILNEQIIFDATTSNDIDDNNTELNYTWDFKDGAIKYGRIVTHSFNKRGDYNVTLTVTDDDLAPTQYVITISVSSGTTSDGDGIAGDDLGWVVAIVGIVVFIIIFIIVVLFVLVPRKRKRLEAEASRFVTIGKLDFVILKKPGRKDFRKFELHGISTPATIPRAAVPLATSGEQLQFGKPLEVQEQPEPEKATHMGIYWKTTFLDSSWVIYDTAKGNKMTAIAILNNEINILQSKNWVIDYAGNGTILPSKPSAQPLSIEGLATQSPIDQNNI